MAIVNYVFWLWRMKIIYSCILILLNLYDIYSLIQCRCRKGLELSISFVNYCVSVQHHSYNILILWSVWSARKKVIWNGIYSQLSAVLHDTMATFKQWNVANSTGYSPQDQVIVNGITQHGRQGFHLSLAVVPQVQDAADGVTQHGYQAFQPCSIVVQTGAAPISASN